MAEDLSTYERLRLENIQRNAQFLLELGIVDRKANNLLASTAEKKATVTATKRKKKHKRAAITADFILPTRKSPRLHKILDLAEVAINSTECIGDGTEDSFSYETMPFDSDQLDDEEFQAYVELRAWRLRTARELELEPYKICQNRTLAELVRRKRNRDSWISLGLGNKTVEVDLLDCWGIGPSKAKLGGFGHQLAELLHTDSIAQRLEASRKLSPGSRSR
jgi:hypothetical protein